MSASYFITHCAPNTPLSLQVTSILSVQCGPALGALTLGTLAAYGTFTLGITSWRTRFRRTMNKAEVGVGACVWASDLLPAPPQWSRFTL